MNTIWFLSEERNLCITGFNRIVKDDNTTELWVQEITGKSKKIATGQQAVDLERALLDIIWSNSPAIITDGKGRFSTNVNINNQAEEVE